MRVWGGLGEGRGWGNDEKGRGKGRGRAGGLAKGREEGGRGAGGRGRAKRGFLVNFVSDRPNKFFIYINLFLYTLNSSGFAFFVFYIVGFHQVGYLFLSYLTKNDRIFLWTFGARISRVLRVRRPEARRWNGRDLYFPKPCLELKNAEIKLVCVHQTFRLLLTVTKNRYFEK